MLGRRRYEESYRSKGVLLRRRVRRSGKITRSKVRKEVDHCGLLREREGVEEEGGKKSLVLQGEEKAKNSLAFR